MLENEKRCSECGEFYHADAMNGDKCYSCFDDKSVEDNE